MYRLVSSKQTVAKLYRDLRLTDSRYVTDMVEWFGEAMGYTRVFPSLERKVVKLNVTMHRVELPQELVKIQQVAELLNGKDENIVVMQYNSSSFPKSLHTIDSPNPLAKSHQRYIVNFNYIETTFETGVILLAYMAIPLDDDGFPMVLDEVSFQEALKWYVALRMAEGGWKHPSGMGYGDIESRWMHYCAQSRQKNKMPDIDQYQRFLDSWVRLVPDYSRHEFYFDPAASLKQDVVDASGIVIRGVDQVSHFGSSEDESPSPS